MQLAQLQQQAQLAAEEAQRRQRLQQARQQHAERQQLLAASLQVGVTATLATAYGPTGAAAGLVAPSQQQQQQPTGLPLIQQPLLQPTGVAPGGLLQLPLGHAGNMAGNALGGIEALQEAHVLAALQQPAAPAAHPPTDAGRLPPATGPCAPRGVLR